MSTRGWKRSLASLAVAIPVVALMALVAGCPWDEEENPYDKECRWMAGDAGECWGLASSQGCVGHKYDPGSLNCLGEHCIDCDVTGVSCPQKCAEQGLGSNGYRETDPQACMDRIQEMVRNGAPARGGYLFVVQCCCLPS